MEADGLLVFFLCVADLTLSDFISSSSSSSDDEVKGYIHNNGLNCLLFLKSHLVCHISFRRNVDCKISLSSKLLNRPLEKVKLQRVLINKFSNVHKLKVQAAEIRVQENQELLDAGPTDSLHTFLAEAKASLHNHPLLQETHWRKKSRIGWLKEGDRKIAFFHASTKSRGVVNRID
ncbi:hypothetical protein MRB53_009078 [Persea americana]|uniref:Uncharacterized protein n=1 Tax=Persea americana TaxID=3435 RepID=A0ACC2LMX8_PERAE|nr:hypothetical protein MRB53_009078 [Persea americana]